MRDTVWTFNTDKFRVTLELSPSYEPYDGDDEDGEIQRNLNIGVYVMFDSIVRVVYRPRGIELGGDSLSSSVYAEPSEFWTGEGRNGYFRDMVRGAIHEARKAAKEIGSIKLRQ